MAMRVTYNMIYDKFVNNMNSSLSKLMDLNIMAQTQKKVNRPSDDPVGMTRILDHRGTVDQLKQFKDNTDSAKAWLGLSDNTMTQVSDLLTRAKEIAEQGATGSMTADNREQLSYAARQLFQQFITLANTRYEGKSLYAGQKTDQDAFQQKLWITSNDSNVSSASFSITGDSKNTVLVQFLSSGDIDTDTINYRYSTDGGDTFTNGTVAAGNSTLDLGGVRLALAPGTTVRACSPTDTNDNSGTWVWVRPTAQYMGDDEDSVSVDQMGAGASPLSPSAQGMFVDDVMVRIDNGSAVNLDGRIEYSFSVNGGRTWTTGNVASNGAVASNAVLSVPGGVLTINSNGGNTIARGTNYVVRPRTAEINFEISQGETVRVNEVGKDVFGGVYQAPGASRASTALNTGTDSMYFSNSATAANYNNLFETMGNLVAFLETNNQDGVQQALDNLNMAQQHVLNTAASVGGRENRLAVNENILTTLAVNEEERISQIEDIDVGELMSQLAQADVVYQAVLKSSSMIMNMNLMQYI